MNGVFETVLHANRQYVEAIERNERAEVQINLLKTCEILMKTMIIDAGLSQEYRDYCDAKTARA